VTLTLALLLTVAIGTPHGLALERTAPGTAACIWLLALVLRALATVFAVVYIVLFVPSTELFQAVTHWCWHTVLPMLATHLPVDGHTVGAVATVLPAFVLAGSFVSVAFGLWRAARAVRTLLQRRTLGPGPEASIVLDDGQVVVAAAGLRRPQVVVSAGALATFDDEELAASLAHERGHIARHHRWVLVLAELCRAVGRFLPGTTAASRELLFHLERDADRYAVELRHHPAVLASAICKAATAPALAAPAFGLGGAVVARRVRQLLDGEPARRSRRERLLTLLATLMAALAVTGTATLPAAAHTGLHHTSHGTTPALDCPR
jgi:Zn-dependent protease with chaperone function